MPMTEEERFRFDLTGFLVRPAILTPDQVAAIVDQIDRLGGHGDKRQAEQNHQQGLPLEQMEAPLGSGTPLSPQHPVAAVLFPGPDYPIDHQIPSQTEGPRRSHSQRTRRGSQPWPLPAAATATSPIPAAHPTSTTPASPRRRCSQYSAAMTAMAAGRLQASTPTRPLKPGRGRSRATALNAGWRAGRGASARRRCSALRNRRCSRKNRSPTCA